MQERSRRFKPEYRLRGRVGVPAALCRCGQESKESAAADAAQDPGKLGPERLSYSPAARHPAPRVNRHAAGGMPATGLKVKAALDTDRYASGIKVSHTELGAVRISRHAFHGEWNYSILPNAKIG